MKIKVHSSKREEIIDITQEVERIVGKRDGLCVVYTPHATCGIIVNENYDEAVCEDILEALRKLFKGNWKHDKIDNNADAHIKSSIIGPSQVIPVKSGKLALGRWQGIGLCEFDGPREREIIVEVVNGTKTKI